MSSLKSFARVLPISLCLLASLVQGQTAAAGSNWQRVQQLPLHTRVHVSADGKSRLCSIDKVDETQLTCSAGRVMETSHFTFQRGNIKSIKASHQMRSTLVGAGVGAAAGAIIGVAINGGGPDQLIHFSNAEVGGVGAIIFAVPGAVIGLATDFTRSPTVYRR
jgi:hypothetical protein